MRMIRAGSLVHLLDKLFRERAGTDAKEVVIRTGGHDFPIEGVVIDQECVALVAANVSRIRITHIEDNVANNRQRTAIVLTECNIQRNNTFSYSTKKTAIPVSRIAKVDEHKVNMTVVPEDERDNQPQSRLTLRTPEDYLLVRESVEMVNARMNGDETFRDTAGVRHEASRG